MWKDVAKNIDQAALGIKEVNDTVASKFSLLFGCDDLNSLMGFKLIDIGS